MQFFFGGGYALCHENDVDDIKIIFFVFDER